MRTETHSGTGRQAGAAALGVEERSDETPRAKDHQARSAPEVIAKPARRQFTAEYRLRIVEEADRCTRPGEVGRMLRREGLTGKKHCKSAWRRLAGGWAYRGQPSTVVTGPLPGASSPARALREDERERVAGDAVLFALRRPLCRSRSSRRFSTKGTTFARNARCIGFWLQANRCANDEISSLTPATPSPSWSRVELPRLCARQSLVKEDVM